MSKPFVSFCLFTYNQEKFVIDALNGAVEQDYDNMEIIISDDCSNDSTPQLIQEFVNNYKGNHKIVVNINEHNMGIAAHVCKVLYEIAKGEIILVAAGDDISQPARTSMTVEYFNRFPEITSLSFLTQPVKTNLSMGTPYHLLTLLPHSYSIYNIDDYLRMNMGCFSGDSRALRKSVIDAFPPISIAPAEDYFLYLRSLMIGAIAYIREPILLRRQHENNVSAMIPRRDRLKRNYEQFVFDINWALEHNYITERIAKKLKKKTKRITKFSYWKVMKAIMYNKIKDNKLARKIYYKTRL